MSVKTIRIADDFSLFPGGRCPDDGPHSGQEFLNDILLPALKEYEQVVLELDGTKGYGSSFLEEVFGGLIRHGYTMKHLENVLTLRSSRKSVISEINKFMQRAETAAQTALK